MRVFISGITGTLGQQVVRLLDKDKHVDQIIGYSRDEQKQRVSYKSEKTIYYLGDIRDERRLLEATRGVDIIYHFAALKCVDTLEENPEESVKTNIYGTENILHAQRIHEIPRVVFTSTDKACLPINAYGMCKAVAERLVLRNPNNVVCRYGNVLASRGSVVPEFVRTIKSEGKAYITDPRMTRFWIRQEDAAKFVIDASQGSGGLKIPNMRAYPVKELANLIGKMVDKSVEFIDVGIRKGEKLHEDLKSFQEGGHIRSNEKFYLERTMKDLIKDLI